MFAKSKRMLQAKAVLEFWVPDGSALIYVSYLKGQQGGRSIALIPKAASTRP